MNRLVTILAILAMTTAASAQQVSSKAAAGPFGPVLDPNPQNPPPVMGLTAVPLDSVSVRLTFTATSDSPSSLLAAASYVIYALPSPPDTLIYQFQTYPNGIDLSTHQGVLTLSHSMTPAAPGTTMTVDVTGLNPGNQALQVIFQVQAIGSTGLVSQANSAAMATLATDHIAPGSIVALTTTPGALADDVILHWTATGDDLASGFASRYEIRQSGDAILTESQYAAAQVLALPAPLPSANGSPEQMTLQGLERGVPHFFAARACDEVDNAGPFSWVYVFLPGDPAGSFLADEKGKGSFGSCAAGPAAGSMLLPLALAALLLRRRTLQS